MKKTLILIIFMVLFSLSSCKKEYTGPKINTIKYFQNFQGLELEKTLNLESNELISQYHYKNQEKIVNTYQEEQEKELINYFYQSGLFDLKEHYTNILNQENYLHWELIIEYEDGSSTVSIGDNKVPESIFNKCDIKCYNLMGIDLLDSLEDTYKKTPSIEVSLYDLFGTPISKSSASLQAVNFDWNSYSNKSNDLIQYADQNLYYYFEPNMNYQMSIRSDISYDHFKQMTLYEIDKTGNNEKEIVKKEWFPIEYFDIQVDKYYKLVYEYPSGNCEYIFSTKPVDLTKLPNDFFFQIAWGENGNCSYSSINNEQIINGTKETIHLSQEALLEIYQELGKKEFYQLSPFYYPKGDRTFTSNDISLIFNYNNHCEKIIIVNATLEEDTSGYLEGKELMDYINYIYKTYLKNK